MSGRRWVMAVGLAVLVGCGCSILKYRRAGSATETVDFGVCTPRPGVFRVDGSGQTYTGFDCENGFVVLRPTEAVRPKGIAL